MSDMPKCIHDVALDSECNECRFEALKSKKKVMTILELKEKISQLPEGGFCYFEYIPSAITESFDWSYFPMRENTIVVTGEMSPSDLLSVY
jgi:hypothetical protein